MNVCLSHINIPECKFDLSMKGPRSTLGDEKFGNISLTYLGNLSFHGSRNAISWLIICEILLHFLWPPWIVGVR